MLAGHNTTMKKLLKQKFPIFSRQFISSFLRLFIQATFSPIFFFLKFDSICPGVLRDALLLVKFKGEKTKLTREKRTKFSIALKSALTEFTVYDVVIHNQRNMSKSAFQNASRYNKT